MMQEVERVAKDFIIITTPEDGKNKGAKIRISIKCIDLDGKIKSLKMKDIKL